MNRDEKICQSEEIYKSIDCLEIAKQSNKRISSFSNRVGGFLDIAQEFGEPLRLGVKYSQLFSSVP